jgi:hypothetical protein
MTDLGLFEEKIEAYFQSCHPWIDKLPDKSFLAEWPLYKFSITTLSAALEHRTAIDIHRQIRDKLIDIKLHYAYLATIDEHFYRGATLIVGNGELEKLNPRTISLLRAVHYKVYLLSVLIEEILDLLWLVVDGKASNFQRRKWDKIIERVDGVTGTSIIDAQSANCIKEFKSSFRTAEMHKFSMVRAFTSKANWNHLQAEQEVVASILRRMYVYYTENAAATAS